MPVEQRGQVIAVDLGQPGQPESGLPSDRHPDRPSGTIVLEDVTVWLDHGDE
jgi:hypothetical protein